MSGNNSYREPWPNSGRWVHPPRIPIRAYKMPGGPDWVYEIKHDGYRLQVRRNGDQVGPFTRGGYDWTVSYPAIADTAAKLGARSFTLDGEAVVCGPDELANDPGRVDPRCRRIRNVRCHAQSRSRSGLSEVPVMQDVNGSVF
jgi:ATP-dependent DNA ligase